MSVVVNATPLIALSVIDRLDLLRLVFGEVLVPTGVFVEVVNSEYDRPGLEAAIREQWLRVVPPVLSPAVEPVLLGLDQVNCRSCYWRAKSTRTGWSSTKNRPAGWLGRCAYPLKARSGYCWPHITPGVSRPKIVAVQCRTSPPPVFA